MPTCRCPNCGARLEYRFFLYQKDERQPNAANLFQSTAPTGFLRSFVHRVVRNRPLRAPEQPRRPDIIVRAEIKKSPRVTWINELAIQATPEQLKMLGIIYVERGLGWARDTTTEHMNVSQTWHNRIAHRFLALEFLKKVGHNRYALTDEGKRFLEYYLYDHPWRQERVG